MERNKERTQMLDLMLRPAFSVEDGTIRHINPAAAKVMLTEGTPIAPLLATGKEEYADFTGCIQLSVQLGPQTVDATVVRMEDVDIFLPDQLSADAQLQVLSLASMQLRESLTGLAAVTDRLLPEADATLAAQANRRVYQLMRILSNMADAPRFSRPSACRMEYTEVCSFIEEILEKAGSMLENIQLRIESRLPGTPIFTLLDREQMERAIYNLLSNAAKYGRPGTPIQVQLQQQNQRLRLSVTNSTDDPVAPQQLYDQFLRELTLEDPAKGLGLGLLLVRRAAVNHGGVLLMDQPARGNTRLTMTFAIRHSDSSGVRSPIFGMDYAGERDHALLELADVLPAELYRPEKN
jgi:signal transduction histidine kinase